MNSEKTRRLQLLGLLALGLVRSVNGVKPDAYGNVEITVSSGGTGGDTVTNITVNGVKPDENGNIEITVNGVKPDENGNIQLSDGVTPKLRINESTYAWEVSYDEGKTWESLGVIAKGEDGEDGEDGDNGATFTPAVDADGNLSWSNDKGLNNPGTVNIKGPKPEAGKDYYTSEEKTVFVESVMEEIPYLTALDTVIETDKIVMTQSLSDGTTSVLTALLDENYMPYQATVDGRVIPMTWTLPESNEDEETPVDPEPEPEPDEPVEEEWDGVLFDNGVTNEEVTGGWDTDGYSLGTNYPNNGSGSVGDTIAVATSAAYTSCIVGTEIAVDLTDWNTLTAEVSEATNAFELSSALRVCSTKEAENTAAAVTLVSGTNTIDISALSGSYYIAVSVSGSSTIPNMTAAVTKLFASK